MRKRLVRRQARIRDDIGRALHVGAHDHTIGELLRLADAHIVCVPPSHEVGTLRFEALYEIDERRIVGPQVIGHAEQRDHAARFDAPFQASSNNSRPKSVVNMKTRMLRSTSASSPKRSTSAAASFHAIRSQRRPIT